MEQVGKLTEELHAQEKIASDLNGEVLIFVYFGGVWTRLLALLFCTKKYS